MHEISKRRDGQRQGVVVGAALMVLGATALAVALDPSAGDAILKFWPVSLIGVGLALIFRREVA